MRSSIRCLCSRPFALRPCDSLRFIPMLSICSSLLVSYKFTLTLSHLPALVPSGSSGCCLKIVYWTRSPKLLCTLCLFEIRISLWYIHIPTHCGTWSMRSKRLWNIKRVSVIIAVLVLLYVFVFSSGYQKHQIDGVIANTRPEMVWEYVADFSKMRLLNPTM